MRRSTALSVVTDAACTGLDFDAVRCTACGFAPEACPTGAIAVGGRGHGEAAGPFAQKVVRHLAAGFADDPGDNGVDGFDSWLEKGRWFNKPYIYRQVRGEFFQWDGNAFATPMSEEEVKADLSPNSIGFCVPNRER